MKKFQIGILIILAAVIGFLVWTNISKKAEQPTTGQPIRIGLVPWIGHGLYYVANEKGFFANEKVNVEIVAIDDSGVGKQLLNTGRVEALSLTPETVVVLHDAGVKVRAVAMTDTSEGADGVIVTGNIKDFADLRDKKVAFEVGSPSHFLLSYLLDQRGLTTKDLVVIDNPAPDAGTAFLTGNVDAAVTWEPWLSKANERRGGYLLANSKATPILPALPIFRVEVIESRPQDIKAMLRALFSAREWILSNQGEAVKIVAKNFNITEQEVRDQLPTFRWFSYQDNLSGFTTGQYSPKNLIQSAGDLWLKLGLVKSEVNADELIDSSILKNLYK